MGPTVPIFFFFIYKYIFISLTMHFYDDVHSIIILLIKCLFNILYKQHLLQSYFVILHQNHRIKLSGECNLSLICQI